MVGFLRDYKKWKPNITKIYTIFNWRLLIFLLIFILFFFQLRLVISPLAKDIAKIQNNFAIKRSNAYLDTILQPFNWLKQNTPEGSIILAPSYEAHRILAFADRKVIASGKVYPSETKELARRFRDLSKFFFTTDIKEAKKIAEKYQAKYIFISKTPKFLEFCGASKSCHWVTYNPEGLTPDAKKKTLIGRLLEGEIIPEFPLIHTSSGYLIFEIKPNPSPIAPITLSSELIKSRIETSLEKVNANLYTPKAFGTLPVLLASYKLINGTNDYVLKLLGSNLLSQIILLFKTKEAKDPIQLADKTLTALELWKITGNSGYLTEAKSYVEQLNAFAQENISITKSNTENVLVIYAINKYAQMTKDEELIGKTNKIIIKLKDDFLMERISSSFRNNIGAPSLDVGIWLARISPEDKEFTAGISRWILEHQYAANIPKFGGAFKENASANTPSPIITAKAAAFLLETAPELYREQVIHAFLLLLKQNENAPQLDAYIAYIGLLLLNQPPN